MQSSLLLQEISRVLRPGGLIFLVTPNFSSPIRLLRGRHWYGYQDPTHINFYNYQSITKQLKRHRLHPLAYRFFIPYFLPFDWAYVPKYHPQWLQFILNNLVWYSPLAYLRDSIWCLVAKQTL